MTDTLENRRSRPAQAPDGTTYWVVAAKKGLPFNDIVEGFSADLNPLSRVLSWVLAMIINGVLNVSAKVSPSWKVGVVRVGRLGEKFVHKELLAPGLDPEQRMDELVDLIRLGSESEGTGEDHGPHRP